MVTSNITASLLLGSVLVLVSCATPPKATAVAEAPVVKKVEPVAPVPVVTPPPTEVPKNPLLAEIRTPDMLKMPTDSELRSSAPVKPKEESGAGAVVSRPPADTIADPKKTPPPAAAQ
jgi:hypothetical protein